MAYRLKEKSTNMETNWILKKIKMSQPEYQIQRSNMSEIQSRPDIDI